MGYLLRFGCKCFRQVTILQLLLSNRGSWMTFIALLFWINTRRIYKLVTLTTVMLLLPLAGGHVEGLEVKVDQAQCEAACDMGIYFDGIVSVMDRYYSLAFVLKCFWHWYYYSAFLVCFLIDFYTVVLNSNFVNSKMLRNRALNH